jgi:uncharacterized membrane protein
MDPTHFHLVFTHAVVWLAIAGTILLAWGLIRKSADVRNVALGMVLFSALLAIPVYLTGEEAEHTVEEYGVSNDAIEEHEESAELTFILIEVLGLAALMALLLGMRRNTTNTLPSIIVLIIGLIVGFFAIRTAYLGGSIRHEEIREDAPTTGDVSHEGEEREEEQDDEPEPTPESWDE